MSTVYHGSQVEFTNPDLSRCKNFRDFGKGFYVTENFYDALSILNYKEGFVYEYELDLESYQAKTFDNTEDLANYVILNRTKLITDKYDLVIGKTVPNCSDLFKKVRNNSIKINKKTVVDLVNSSPYDNQICIKSDNLLSKLKLTRVHFFSKEDFC